MPRIVIRTFHPNVAADIRPIVEPCYSPVLRTAVTHAVFIGYLPDHGCTLKRSGSRHPAVIHPLQVHRKAHFYGIAGYYAAFQ